MTILKELLNNSAIILCVLLVARAIVVDINNARERKELLNRIMARNLTEYASVSATKQADNTDDNQEAGLSDLIDVE